MKKNKIYYCGDFDERDWLIIILCFLITAIICTWLFRNVKEYIYVDMNGSTGKTSDCFYDKKSRDYRCMIPVKVQQYYEVK